LKVENEQLREFALFVLFAFQTVWWRSITL